MRENEFITKSLVVIGRFLLSAMFAVIILSGCVTTKEYSIITEPVNATIKLDGSSIGSSPVNTTLQFNAEKLGYSVEINKNGYLPATFFIPKEYRGEYLVRSDGNKYYLRITLDPIITLLMNTEPNNATVTIDGENIGDSPIETKIEFTKEKAGYDVEINKKGYLTKTFYLSKPDKGEYMIREDGNKWTLKVPLEKYFKEIQIDSEPTGANIYVNNVHVGLSPMKVKLEYGEQLSSTVKVVKPDYQTVSKTISMDYQLDSIFFKLAENTESKMAYILSDVDAADNKIKFKVFYEEAYKDTIEKSPNVLQVNRLIQTDDVNILFDRMAISGDYLVYTYTVPKSQINTAVYVARVESLSKTVKNLETLLSGDVQIIASVLEDNALQDSLSNKVYSQLISILEAVAKDKGIDNYREELSSITSFISEIYKKLIDFNQTEFYSELWTINLKENFKKSKVTHADGRWIDSSPAIAKDKIYFSSNRNSEEFEIWRVNLGKGSGLTRITNSPYSQDIEPAINNNGDLISYSSLPLGAKDYQIWTINADGTLPSQLKPGTSPSICSDKIAFSKKSTVGINQLWMMNTDGLQETLLSVNTKSDDSDPNFSLDCKWIAFTSNESGNKDIWILQTNGSNRTQLTTNPSTDMHPVWGNDGSIYFVSNRGLLWGIWRLKPRISDEEQIDKGTPQVKDDAHVTDVIIVHEKIKEVNLQ